MKQIGKLITLSKGEQDVCILTARARTKSNRDAGVKNSKHSEESDFFIDLEGIGAEVAFCKLQNIFPDFSICPRKTHEDLGDAMIDGKKVDVKTTIHKNGRLIAANWKKKTVDLFALMVGKFPVYEFRGFMLADELLKESRLKTFSNGKAKCYQATQDELVELYELWLFTDNW